MGCRFSRVAEQQVNGSAIGLKTEVQERKEDKKIYITYYPITPTPARACKTRVYARTRETYGNGLIGFHGSSRPTCQPDGRVEPRGQSESFTRLSGFSDGHGGRLVAIPESKVSTVAFPAPTARPAPPVAPRYPLARSSRPWAKLARTVRKDGRPPPAHSWPAIGPLPVTVSQSPISGCHVGLRYGAWYCVALPCSAGCCEALRCLATRGSARPGVARQGKDGDRRVSPKPGTYPERKEMTS